MIAPHVSAHMQREQRNLFVFFVGVSARGVQGGDVSLHPADATALAVRGRVRAAVIAPGRLFRFKAILYRARINPLRLNQNCPMWPEHSELPAEMEEVFLRSV